MKKFISIILSAVLICGSLIALNGCGKGKILDTIVSDSNKYELYGKDTISYIKVFKGSKLIFDTKVKGVTTADELYPNYGFIYKDMDFDDIEDFGIIVFEKDGTIKYNCYTYSEKSKDYKKNQYLSSLENISFDYERQNVIEMKISKIYNPAVIGSDKPRDYTEGKTKIIYKWIENQLIEQTRTSVVYYSESNIYSYITYTYDSDGYAEEDIEIWLEEYEIENFLAQIDW